MTGPVIQPVVGRGVPSWRECTCEPGWCAYDEGDCPLCVLLDGWLPCPRDHEYGLHAGAVAPGAARPEVVTLCGSMRFFPLMLRVAAEETAAGRIVLAPFAVVERADQGSELTARLDELHRRKIDLADRVVVVTDESGYYGASTRAEIAYATAAGTPVTVRAVASWAREVGPPLTGVGAGVWHAIERVFPTRPGEPEPGIAVCGAPATVAATYGVFDRDRFGDRACPGCGWLVAIRAGTVAAEITRLGTPETGDLAARVAAAVLAAAGQPHAGYEPEHPYTVQLLGAVSAHAPTALISRECGEGGCGHLPHEPCPTVALACLSCSQRSGGWAGEWKGICMPEATISAPCEVLRALAAHYQIPVTADAPAHRGELLPGSRS